MIELKAATAVTVAVSVVTGLILMRRRLMQRILIFGSSCNPPTQSGHLQIVSYFSGDYDEIWVLPVYRHIFDTKRNLAPFERRVEMSKLTFRSVLNAVVKETEKDVSLLHSGAQTGTIDVLRHLKAVCAANFENKS